MGWSFGWDTRKSLIAELTETETNEHRTRTCLAKFASGNTLWTVWEITPTDKPNYRYIGCDLLAKHGGEWGHKGMDESMRPFYYSCPIKYLDMVPEDERRGTSTDWREKVRAYHANRSTKGIKFGDIIGIKSSACPALKVVSVKPLHATNRHGTLYRVSPKNLSGKRWGSWEEYEESVNG